MAHGSHLCVATAAHSTSLPSVVASHTHSAPTRPLHMQDVGRALALLGVPYVIKAVSEDGLFAFNLALPERWVGG